MPRTIRQDFSEYARLSKAARSRFDVAGNDSRARAQYRYHPHHVHRLEQIRRHYRNALALQGVLRSREVEVVESAGSAFRSDHRSGHQARGDCEGTEISPL